MNAPLQLAIPASPRAIEIKETQGLKLVIPTPPDRDTIVIPRTTTDLFAFPGIAPTQVGKGAVLFVPANTCTRIGLGEGHSAFVLTICPTLRHQVNHGLDQLGGQVPATALMIRDQHPITEIAGLLRRMALPGMITVSTELDLLVQLLFWNIARIAGLAAPVPEPRKPRLGPVPIARIDRFIDDNLEAGLRLQQLADLVGMSRYHFLRCFKQATGLSPLQYVLARKIDRAQALLAERDLSIAEIAYATGFSSQSHLNAMFKRHFGVTPGAYRRQLPLALHTKPGDASRDWPRPDLMASQ